MTLPGTPRPFRFFADASYDETGRPLAETARVAEDLGYDVLVVVDHLLDIPGPIAAMATIAAATSRIGIGTFVLNNDLRHPAVLAQELAAIDIASGGRLQIGIGAGWNEPEYRAIGIPFDPISVRQARLAEAVAVLKGCFADEPFSFHGEHYTISDRDGGPKPIQRPHPRFLIGGGGRRTLTLAAREADIVGLAPRIGPGQRPDPGSLSVAATEEKIAWVREAAGDRFAELELNVYPSTSPIVVTDHARKEATDLADRLRVRTGRDVAVDELLESPHIFIGSIDGLTEKVRGLRDRLGINSFMLGGVGQLAPIVERLAGT